MKNDQNALDIYFIEKRLETFKSWPFEENCFCTAEKVSGESCFPCTLTGSALSNAMHVDTERLDIVYVTVWVSCTCRTVVLCLAECGHDSGCSSDAAVTFKLEF